MSYRCTTPVVVLLFERTDTLETVMARVRMVRPTVVYLVADGPRPNDREQAGRCEDARRLAEDSIDWPCEIHTEYADKNLGTKARFETGFDRVFASEEAAIIVADDAVVEPSMFRFFDEMLERYRFNDRILSVGGLRLMPPDSKVPWSYFFTVFQPTWGWATWRRSWEGYDRAMSSWPDLRGTDWLSRRVQDGFPLKFWRSCFDRNFRTQRYFDYSWQLYAWKYDALAITPSTNLVANVGYRSDATLTADTSSPFASSQTDPIAFPLRHPPTIGVDDNLDRAIEEFAFSGEYKRVLERRAK